MINETWRLAPWADLLYACDHHWWMRRAPGAHEFQGLRVQGHIGARDALYPGCMHGFVLAKSKSRMIFEGAAIGAGGHSGFQAINMVARTGCTEIILLGFDLTTSGGSHWHGDHGAGLTNPNDRFLADCARILDAQHTHLAARGISVVNASRVTSLSKYKRASVDEALGIK